METETRQLQAKIQEQLQKLTANCDKAFNYLSQQQQQQEKERESRLETLEAKIIAMANPAGPCCFCSSRDVGELRSVQCPDGDPAKKNNHKDPCGYDVLHLNIGGSKQIAVLRSTLTFVEGSMLATRFSGRWDDSLEKDRDGNFFIDQPADLFIPMIDFLQCKTKETPQHPSISFPSVEDFGGSFNRFKKFANMVEYYGVTAVVLPARIRLLTAQYWDTVRISGHYVHVSTSAARFDVVTWPWEPRRIQSFDVAIEAVGTLRVGWALGSWSFPDQSKQPEVKYTEIGTIDGSIGYNCVSNIVSHPYYSPEGRLRFNESSRKYQVQKTEMSVQAGSVIRCQRRGSNYTWSSGGKEFTCNPGFSDAGEHRYYYRVPAFSGRGTWWISNIEYGEGL
jgi:hypothetical protein